MVILLAAGVTTSIAQSAPDKDKSTPKENIETATVKEQKWEFYSNITPPTMEALSAEQNYKFGELAGCLYNTFLKVYITKEEIVPGDPRRRNIIQKPAIYKAVRLIEKQLKKDVKNQKLNLQEASTRFESVLKKAISAFDSETASFEKALTACRKNIPNLYEVFDSVELIEI